MTNVAKISIPAKRTDWTLSSGELVRGISELETGALRCFQIGSGVEYGLEPRHGGGTITIVFNAVEVRNAYAAVYKVDFPHEVRDFNEREIHEMYHGVQEYVERRYVNNFTERVIFIRPATKKIPW